MNINQILKTVLFTPGSKGRWGLPVIFIGPPGIAKTQRMERFAETVGLRVEVIIGSIREPTDVGGLARLEEDCFRLVPAAWAKQFSEEGHQHGLVFLDELNTNVPAMQAAMLRLATDGAVGEYIMPPTVRVLAAMNDAKEAAGGWDLAPPLANRFGHLPWPAPNVVEWSNWFLGAADENVKMQKAKEIEATVKQNFDKPFAMAKGLVTGFLKAQPSLIHKMPTAGSPDAGRAWPSPRTWELATRALAGADVHDLDQSDKEALLTAFVGVGPAAELIQYQTKADLPDPSDVLDEKIKFKHDPKRLDRTTAVLNSCAAIIAPDKAPRRKERADVLWRIIAEISTESADICVQSATVLAKRNFITGKDAYAALSRLQPILAAAGYNAKRDD